VNPRWPRLAAFLEKRLPAITACCLAVMLASIGCAVWRLAYHAPGGGFLDTFMATTWHGKAGLDFFSVPRGFINLIHGKSIYDTWGCAYGPYASWFPYHPAAAVLAGSWLSLFPPWTAYGVFVLFSAALLAGCAKLAGRYAATALERKTLYFLFLCSPPAYLLLWNGQLHVFTVAAVSLVCAEFLSLQANPASGGLRPMLAAGLLISLLTKPVLLPALPVLAAVRPFRKTVALSLAVYAAVSLAFILIRPLNPAGLGANAEMSALLHPEIIFKKTLEGNILRVHYRADFLRDNIIHWLNMRNLSSIVRADNFEFMSVSGFFTDLLGPLNPALWKLPVMMLSAFSLWLFFIRDQARRNRAAFFVFAFAILSFYLAYDSVYEYHYTTLMAVMAFIFVSGMGGRAARAACAAGALFYVPTSYFFVYNHAFGWHGARCAAWPLRAILAVHENQPLDWALWIIRYMRVIPALAIFALLSYIIWTELTCEKSS